MKDKCAGLYEHLKFSTLRRALVKVKNEQETRRQELNTTVRWLKFQVKFLINQTVSLAV